MKKSSQSEDIRKFINTEIALSQQRDSEQGFRPEAEKQSSEEDEKIIELIQAEFEEGDETPSEEEENKQEESEGLSQQGEQEEEKEEEGEGDEERGEAESDEAQDEESGYEEEEVYIPPRRELPKRSNRGAKMQHLIEKGLEEDDKNLWKELVGSDFTENESEESKSFNEEASSVRSSEKHDSEDSDIDLTESEGEYSEDESEGPKKGKMNQVRPRKKINFQEIESLLVKEEMKEEDLGREEEYEVQEGQSEEEEVEESSGARIEREKMPDQSQEWEKVKSSKAEAKIRKELRNLRPHRQFNFKDMVDFSPSQLKIDSSTARQTRGAEMRGKSKSGSKSQSKSKSKKAKPKLPPPFIMPSQEEMLRQCAYNELVNSQITYGGGEEFNYAVGQKKYLEKRTRHTKDWSKLDQCFDMKQLLKECRITKVQRIGSEGRIKHHLKVRTPLDSLHFEEGQELLTTGDVLFPERYEKLKRESRKRERYQLEKEGKYRDPVTQQRYSSSEEYIQLQKNAMAKEDDQLMSLYVSVNEFLSANK